MRASELQPMPSIGVLRCKIMQDTPLEISLSPQNVAANRDDDRLCGLGVMRPCKAGKNGFDP
jgi:hypothetical protein